MRGIMEESAGARVDQGLYDARNGSRSPNGWGRIAMGVNFSREGRLPEPDYFPKQP